MALAVTLQSSDPVSGGAHGQVFGNLKVRVANLTFDATSYPAGGFAVTPVTLGLPNKVLFATAQQVAPSTGAVTGGLGEVSYNTTTNKIQVFNSTGVEGAPTTSLTGLVVQVIAFGY